MASTFYPLIGPSPFDLFINFKIYSHLFSYWVAHMYRGQRITFRSCISFYHVGLRDRTQVPRLGCKRLYPGVISLAHVNELLSTMFRDFFLFKNNPQVHRKESHPSNSPSPVLRQGFLLGDGLRSPASALALCFVLYIP